MSIIDGKWTNRWASSTLQKGFTILLVDNKTIVVPSLYATLRRLLLGECRLLSGSHAQSQSLSFLSSQQSAFELRNLDCMVPKDSIG
jgi:hypothetical protein